MGVKGNRIIKVLSKLCAKFADPYRVSNKYTVTHINTFCLLFQIEVSYWLYWRRRGQLTPVFLPGKPHRQRSLGGL